MKTSSNLEAFLQAATPLLPWPSATMERFQGTPSSVWKQPDGKNKDAMEYFALSGIWEHYAESSALGLAEPVREAGDRANQVRLQGRCCKSRGLHRWRRIALALVHRARHQL